MLSLALAAVVMTGCGAYRDSLTPMPAFGNAVSQNAAVMIIDPQPVGAANTNIDFDGRAAGLAVERYREGKVIPPVELRTSGLGTSGSEGSGGGGAP
jgi:hypothetical protein